MEGSRFGAHTAALAVFVATRMWPKDVKTSGSRERSSVMQLDSGASMKIGRRGLNATRWVVPGSRLLP